MASFDANIDLEVVVRSKQLDKLEQRLEKINKFTVTGAGNKEYFDTKNAIAYNRQVDGILEKLERIAKFSNQYSEPIGPPINGAYIKKVDDLLAKLEKIAKIDNQFAGRRVGPEQGRTQFSSPIGPNQEAPLTAAQKLTKLRLEQFKIDRAARIEQQKQLDLQAAELKTSQDIARTNSQRLKGLSQYANAIGPEINRLAQLEARAAKEKEESQRRYNTLVDQTISKLERIARIEKQYQRTIGPQSANANQYPGPIGPGQASATALSSRLPPRRQPNRFFTSRGMGARGGFSGGGGLSAGIGFPLLFGSGPGSVLGGAGGSAFGFGGQILGSALGGQLDQLTQKAGDFAKALRGVGSIFDALDATISGVDSQTKRYIQNLEESGQKVEAAALAADVLAQKIGVENAEAFIRAGQAADGATDSLKNVGTILTAIAERFRALGENPTGQTPNGVLDLLPPQFRPTPPTPIEDTPEFKNRTTDLAAQLAIEKLVTQEKLEQAALSTRDLAVQKIMRDLDDKKIDAEQASLKINIEDEKLQRKLADLEEKRADAAERRQKEQQRAREAEQRELERRQREAEAAQRKEDQRQKKLNTAAINLIDTAVKVQELDKGRIAAIDEELRFLARKQGFIEYNIQLSEKDLQVQNILLDVARQKMSIKERELQLERARIQLAQQSQIESISRSGEDFRRGITNEGAGIALGLQDPFGTSQQVQEQVLALEQQERRTAALLPLQRQRNDLIKEGIALQGLESQQARDNRSAQINALDAEINKNTQALAGLEQLELAQSRYNRVLEAAQPYAEAFATGLTQGLRDVVAGTKTAEEAFADFLNNIADMLIQTAATMIAQYIAIGIAKAFAGMGSSGSDFSQFGTNTTGVPTNFIGSGLSGFAGLAEGGFVTGPTPALVGEGGEPEYIIPASKMDGAMARYSSGTRGEAVIDGDGASASGGTEASGAVIDVNYSVERINSVEYVTNAEFQRGMTAAAKQGAELGRKQVYGDLINKRSVRSRLSI